MKKLFAVCLILAVMLSVPFAKVVKAEESSYIDISDARTVYFIGDTFDYGSVSVVYNGFEIQSTNLTVEGFSANTLGSRTVKLSYNGMSVSYNITVYQRVKEIRLISVTHKTSYFTGEQISVADMKIQLVYENDETKNINVEKGWIKGFDSSRPTKKQTLTIDFGGVTTSYDVEIKSVEFPAKNYEETGLTKENADLLEKAENTTGKIAFIVIWAVSLAVLSACVIFMAVKYRRRGKQ